MRRSVQTILPAATAVLLCQAGESGAQSVLATGPEAEVTTDGLHKVDPSIMGATWVKPDLDLSRYTRIFFMPTGVQFRDVRRVRSVRDSAEQFPASEALKNRLRDTFSESFHEAVSDVRSYEPSDELGRDVLMVQGLLTDVISGVPPDLAGSVVSHIRWLWEASVVLELRDSMSHEILARTADRRLVDGPMDANLALAFTLRVADLWSQLLIGRLEALGDLTGRSDVGGVVIERPQE